MDKFDDFNKFAKNVKISVNQNFKLHIYISTVEILNSHEYNILEDNIYKVVASFASVELLTQQIEVGGADSVAVATYAVAMYPVVVDFVVVV